MLRTYWDVEFRNHNFEGQERDITMIFGDAISSYNLSDECVYRTTINGIIFSTSLMTYMLNTMMVDIRYAMSLAEVYSIFRFFLHFGSPLMGSLAAAIIKQICHYSVDQVAGSLLTEILGTTERLGGFNIATAFVMRCVRMIVYSSSMCTEISEALCSWISRKKS